MIITYQRHHQPLFYIYIYIYLYDRGGTFMCVVVLPEECFMKIGCYSRCNLHFFLSCGIDSSDFAGALLLLTPTFISILYKQHWINDQNYSYNNGIFIYSVQCTVLLILLYTYTYIVFILCSMDNMMCLCIFLDTTRNHWIYFCGGMVWLELR